MFFHVMITLCTLYGYAVYTLVCEVCRLWTLFRTHIKRSVMWAIATVEYEEIKSPVSMSYNLGGNEMMVLYGSWGALDSVCISDRNIQLK